MGWSDQPVWTRLRHGGRLASARLNRLRLSLQRHPVVISAPLAVVAVSVGIAAQALLRPGPASTNPDLLDALIAEPAATGSSRSPGPAGPLPAPEDAAQAARDLQAQRGRDGVLPAATPGQELSLEIRVALLRASANPRLSATGPWVLRDRQGQVLRRGGAGEAVDAVSSLSSLAEVWLETTASDAVLVDDRPYAGRLRLLRGANGLQVVNHLPLETYISSVVGAEMPSSWNIEALKAQAVAARSYALAHMARPADTHWHLGDTTRWQAYQGLSSVSGPSRQATAATAGVILSYQGGIVESLYAATQGIADEAHGHLGASMSQHGAQDLAEQGLTHTAILSRYYRGATLARLQAGAG